MTFSQSSVDADRLPWISHRPVAIDHGGPVDVPFEPLAAEATTPAITLFEAMAVRFPDRLAISDGETRLTYVEVQRAVRALAAELDASLPKGCVVAAVLNNTASFPIAILACIAIGRILIPIDATYPAARKAAILREGGPGALLLGEGVEVEDGLVPDSLPRFHVAIRATPEADLPRVEIDMQAPAGVVYTSGSTGRPKGIAYTQRAFMHVVVQHTNACHINPDDKILALASLSVGGTRDALSALLNGAALHIVDIKHAGIAVLLQTLARERITMLSFIPSVMRQLMQVPGIDQALATLRVLELGGERTLQSDLDLFLSKLPAGCAIRVAMGSMEAATVFEWFVRPDVAPNGAVISCGYLARDASIVLLDDDGRSVPPGQAGELVVRSRHMALGAWQNGALRDGPFLHDPDDPQARIFHTGDLIRMRPDGLADHLGRRDRQIKIRGQRADPGDLEAALRLLPGIRDVAVIARRSGGDAVFVAYVAPLDPARPPSVAELKAGLAEDTPSYMMPADIRFIDAIPRLPNFKADMMTLDRLDAEAIDTAPSRSSFSEDQPADSMRALARAVEGAWVQAFGQRAYAGDLPFDESGGDSLKMLTVVFDVERRLGFKLPLDIVETGMRPSALIAAIVRFQADPPTSEPDDRPVVFLLTVDAAAAERLHGLKDTLASRFRFETLTIPRGSADTGAAVAADVQVRQRFYPVNLIALGEAAAILSSVATTVAAQRGRRGLTVAIEARGVATPGLVDLGVGETDALVSPRLEALCARVVRAYVDSESA